MKSKIMEFMKLYNERKSVAENADTALSKLYKEHGEATDKIREEKNLKVKELSIKMKELQPYLKGGYFKIGDKLFDFHENWEGWKIEEVSKYFDLDREIEIAIQEE